MANIGQHTDGVAKVMVSLPDELLTRVDRMARQRGTTRSILLAQLSVAS